MSPSRAAQAARLDRRRNAHDSSQNHRDMGGTARLGLHIQLRGSFRPVHDEPEPGGGVLTHYPVDHAIGYDLVGNLDAPEAARLRVTRRRESRKTDAHKGAHMRLRLVLFAVLVGAIPARAHHSFGATFDANKPVTITGVLT